MFWELLIAIIAGVICGVITGLIPGIHINLVAVMVIGSIPVLLHYTNMFCLAVFIICMSVTHTFLNLIPSIFLGAPEAETALGVLPGHRYLLQGLGIMAVKLTLIGSFGALLISIALFPILVYVVEFIYPVLEKLIGYILLGVVMFMILRDHKKLWAIAIFLFSGSLGILVLNWPNLHQPLFPMFSGMFGVSTLLYSLTRTNRIPPQQLTPQIKLRRNLVAKALFSGNLSGFITALLPGLGAASAAILSMQLTRNLKHHGFMILLGSVNTYNFVLSLVTFYVMDKARNGSIIAVQELVEALTPYQVGAFLAAALVAGCLAVFLTLRIGKGFAAVVSKINYQMLVYVVVAVITLLVYLISGFTGIVVLLVATFVGFLPAIIKITRCHAMGCLLLPVILFFIL